MGSRTGGGDARQIFPAPVLPQQPIGSRRMFPPSRQQADPLFHLPQQLPEGCRSRCVRPSQLAGEPFYRGSRVRSSRFLSCPVFPILRYDVRAPAFPELPIRALTWFHRAGMEKIIRIGSEFWRNNRNVCCFRELPRLRAVAEVSVRQHHYRGHEFESDSCSFEDGMKQSLGVDAARTGTGASPLRPYSACSKSACSVFVGSPVLGPPRWILIIRRGIQHHR